MSLRILHISTRLILGGSQENTVLSCEGQARLGHEVHLAFGPIYGPEGSMLDRVRGFRADDGREIETHELPSMVREIDPLRDLACLREELPKLFQRVQPDVVHTHSSKAGVLGRAAAWKHRNADGSRPVVVHTIHGPPFMPVEGGPLNRAKIRLKNGIYTLAERFAAKRCDTIVSVADAMTEQFRTRGIGREDQYVTVRSGMETARFLEAGSGETREEVRRELGLPDDAFVIGTVARLAEHKGHDDLIDALANDLKKHELWRLLWVGDGWWRERLVARLEQLDLRDRVVLTGLVPPERVAAMIRAMDVLAHPSYREGLPRTVPQALLCGVTCVAYDVDGTGEACRDPAKWGMDDATGRLVPLGDTEALGDAVRELSADAGLRDRLGQNGRQWAAREFDADVMVDRLEDVYRQALEAARGNAGGRRS